MYKRLVSKDFSIEEAALLREQGYLELSNGEKDIVLDFSKCEFIDSTGLGVLVGLFKKCQEVGASMTLENMTERVLRVFRMTRLDGVFRIE